MRRRRWAALALVGLVVACAAAVPQLSPTPLIPTPTLFVATPTPTPTPPQPARVRSVTTVGATVVATGDFLGTRDTQLVLIQDPASDLALRVTMRAELKGTTFVDSVWFASDKGFLALARAKFAVADVDFDGRDDLVALYDAGANTSRIYVWKSTGASFVFANAWWSGEDFAWSRARNLLAGKFGGNERDSLLVTYQDDGVRMRVHSFESNGSAFARTGVVFDSGPGQFDLGKARFAVGRFTRTSGAQELAALYQSASRAKLLLLTPGPTGLTLRRDLYQTDADIDLARLSLAAADVTGDGHDDLVALYADREGGARALVFDPVNGFAPANGWNGLAALPATSVCPATAALAVGDWNGDGRADALALAPAVAGAVRAHLLQSAGTTLTVASSTEALRCPVWPLTGLPTNGADTTVRPLYVKIDNNPSARPHYGIAKADVLYEWLVEGLTTRLAAVFQSQQPDVIGSVRSARMTDRPVLPSLGAAFVYSGGGPEELMAIHYDDAVGHRYVDISPNYGWGYRVDFRHAPYNYFTSYAALRSAVAAAPDGEQPAIVASWSFLPTATGDPLAGGFAGAVPATAITIPYRALFGVRYTYDPATRTYARFQDGEREIDGATKQPIAARDIVVIQTEVHFTEEFGLDPAGNPKLDMVLTGTGKGVVFRDGLRQDVTWSRGDIVDAFTLRNAAGEIVQLSPGQSWIHIVPKDWTIPSS